MGGFKGCFKIPRVSPPEEEKTSKKMADNLRNVDIHPLLSRE